MTALALGVLVFVAAAALDFAYVRYQQHVSARRAARAGAWSAAVYLIGSVGFLAVVQASRWYMIPECAGLYVGTLIALRR